ncbi:hypothetical protein AN958_07657 [Leucoagaricus sp. SymC.cos]|nr:hypothetical protein AN958_07657 [Leucoagaricus sp. SymC.cos]
MANNHGSVATHAHSLPSFSQAFSPHSLSNISTNNNALPPIQSHQPYRLDDRPRSRNPDDDGDDPKPVSRKRTRQDIASSSRDDDGTDPHSSATAIPTYDGAPPHSPSSAASPLKKRRVTVSGAPHPLNTDIRPLPPDQTNSTPISPVVMGLTINREDPAALEQVRSMISVKQKQKALIEQRRGSLAGSSSNPPPPPPPEERISGGASKNPLQPRPSRRSPNTITNTTARRVVLPGQPTGSTHPPSPTPMLVPAHQNPAPAQAQTLPFPPISFARRRAGLLGAGGKKKPADILISPREAQSTDQLQPAIQSAPPIPHAGQGGFQAARFPMTLPRIPPVMGATDNIRRVASNVPPTPTRLSLLRPPATATTPMISSVAKRSPPAPSVPIASSLVPPTPASLQHPGYSGDKSAFLAPFEVFYDALNDSKQLKAWLSEQLQRSNALVQTLTHQQEKLNETIEAAVEKRVSAMKAEIMTLRRRVDDLEDALRNTSTGRRSSIDLTPGLAKGKQPLRNGTNPGPPESYTFPPPSHEQHPRHRPEPSIRRGPSPTWMQDRELRGNPLPPPPQSGDSDRHPSPPYDSRRLATNQSTVSTSALPRSFFILRPKFSPFAGYSQSYHSERKTWTHSATFTY